MEFVYHLSGENIYECTNQYMRHTCATRLYWRTKHICLFWRTLYFWRYTSTYYPLRFHSHGIVKGCSQLLEIYRGDVKYRQQWDLCVKQASSRPRIYKMFILIIADINQWFM